MFPSGIQANPSRVTPTPVLRLQVENSIQIEAQAGLLDSRLKPAGMTLRRPDVNRSGNRSNPR
jgi:hypothetical protein